MTDHRLEGPGENGVGVPRDLPDQQAGAGEDPWEVAPAAAERESESREPEESPEQGGAREQPESGGSEPDVPDTDEAGTGRQGAPHSASGNPEQPVPDESSA
ncbi:hypothetical protein [Streptomyces capillispiralis]|uniref:Uncharacterized protein n=1 Tax=Streptomyces capillispiralis TaxID=68182 RepID=A0A561T8M3_9ACTN|nr:hypothetical protein [Streptomyces capillispiralis]TWF83460.1 hypothetical protein FHX78_11385 [Streptomyces capillispiralis]GHH91752.1 hypothetical protein GCM10017779_22090 [Streptomyces capillispiralis]